MWLRGGLDLTYCTNIHPGSGWEEVSANIRGFAPELKRRLSPDGDFGLGLRLSAREARELLEGARLADFRSYLEGEGMYVALLNGFLVQALNEEDALSAYAVLHLGFVRIHPFFDGNGRVARLMSHAMLLETIDSGAVWSAARGLARGDGAHALPSTCTQRSELLMSTSVHTIVAPNSTHASAEA